MIAVRGDHGGGRVGLAYAAPGAKQSMFLETVKRSGVLFGVIWPGLRPRAALWEAEVLRHLP